MKTNEGIHFVGVCIIASFAMFSRAIFAEQLNYAAFGGGKKYVELGPDFSEAAYQFVCLCVQAQLPFNGYSSFVAKSIHDDSHFMFFDEELAPLQSQSLNQETPVRRGVYSLTCTPQSKPNPEAWLNVSSPPTKYRQLFCDGNTNMLP